MKKLAEVLKDWEAVIGLEVHTELTTLDNKTVSVPNSELSAGQIVNFTREDNRRVDLVVGASYDCDTEDVKKALYDAIARTDKVLADPAPQVLVEEFGASVIKYTVRAWCKHEDYWDVHYGINDNVLGAFKDAGVKARKLSTIFTTAIEDTIHTDVVKNASDIVDLNILQALSKQLTLETGLSERNSRDFDRELSAYIRSQISQAMFMASPMLAVDTSAKEENTESVYLALHPSCARQKNGQPDPGATMEDYIETAVRQLEYLPPETVIERITGDGDKKNGLERTAKKR